MATLQRQLLSLTECKYCSLKEILLYFQSLNCTFRSVGTSHSSNENHASLVFDLFKRHTDLTHLSDEDFVQLLYEFESRKHYNLDLIRFDFLKHCLSQRKSIPFSVANELYDLLKDWSYDEIGKVLSGKIDWESALANEVVLWGKKFDQEYMWNWIVNKNDSNPKLERKALLKIAKEAKNFPKVILIEWAEETNVA